MLPKGNVDTSARLIFISIFLGGGGETSQCPAVSDGEGHLGAKGTASSFGHRRPSRTLSQSEAVQRPASKLMAVKAPGGRRDGLSDGATWSGIGQGTAEGCRWRSQWERSVRAQAGVSSTAALAVVVVATIKAGEIRRYHAGPVCRSYITGSQRFLFPDTASSSG